MYVQRWEREGGADLDAGTTYEHRAWNAGSALLEAFNTLEKLPKVDARSLVVCGQHDGITPLEPGAQRIAELLPNAELKVFANSGHYPFIEEQDVFFGTLEAWLAK